MTNTASGIITNIPPLLPFLEVNNVRQAQADQECQYEHNNDNDRHRYHCANSSRPSSHGHSTRASLNTQR